MLFITFCWCLCTSTMFCSWLATLWKRKPDTGVSEPAFNICSTKDVFLKNSQNSQENTCVGLSFLIEFRSSHSLSSQMFFKIGLLKNFANFTRKHLCWSLFLKKLFATSLSITVSVFDVSSFWYVSIF